MLLGSMCLPNGTMDHLTPKIGYFLQVSKHMMAVLPVTVKINQSLSKRINFVIEISLESSQKTLIANSKHVHFPAFFCT